MGNKGSAHSSSMHLYRVHNAPKILLMVGKPGGGTLPEGGRDKSLKTKTPLLILHC